LLLAAGAGTGATVAYVRGDTETVLQANTKDVTRAAELAAKDMELTVVSADASTLDGKVVARTARDVKVIVVAKAESDQASRVTVRVGNFGDNAMQGAMLEKIRDHLKEGVTHDEARETAPKPITASTSDARI
jgi:hypothetical protein